MLAKFNRRETERQKRNNIVAYTHNIYIYNYQCMCARKSSPKRNNNNNNNQLARGAFDFICLQSVCTTVPCIISLLPKQV